MKLVRPNMTMNWCVWDWNNPIVRLVAVHGSEGVLLAVAARQCPPIAVIIHIIEFDNFRVKFWLFRTSMDWETSWLRNIRHRPDIYFRKINGFVPYGWNRWRSGAVVLGVWLLYEEITYIIPHAVKFFTNFRIQLLFPKLRGFFLVVDKIWII